MRSLIVTREEQMAFNETVQEARDFVKSIATLSTKSADLLRRLTEHPESVSTRLSQRIRLETIEAKIISLVLAPEIFPKEKYAFTKKYEDRMAEYNLKLNLWLNLRDNRNKFDFLSAEIKRMLINDHKYSKAGESEKLRIFKQLFQALTTGQAVSEQAIENAANMKRGHFSPQSKNNYAAFFGNPHDKNRSATPLETAMLPIQKIPL